MRFYVRSCLGPILTNEPTSRLFLPCPSTFLLPTGPVPAPGHGKTSVLRMRHPPSLFQLRESGVRPNLAPSTLRMEEDLKQVFVLLRLLPAKQLAR